MSDHVPPQNLEAEESVLGAMMVSEGAITATLDAVPLRPEHFYRDRHAVVFAAILALSHRGEPVDSISVAEELAKQGKLKKAGGRAAVTQLPNAVPAPGNAAHYGRIVFDAARWRQRLTASHAIQEAALDRDDEKLASGRALLDANVDQTHNLFDRERQQDVLTQLVEGGDPGEFVWPFPDMNEVLSGGHRRDELVVLSGYRNEGKTHLAHQMLDLNAAHGIPCAAYDNENNVKKIEARRAIRQEPRIRFKNLMRGKLSNEERAAYLHHMNHGVFWPVVKVPGKTPEEVCLDIRVRGWDLVIVDILHNFRFREERDLAYAMAVFKETAAIANCCIVLLAHVNRGGITDGRRRPPVCSDLAWSSTIENLADSVWFVYRDQGEKREQLHEGIFYADKLRDGDVGEARQAISFNPRRLRFETRDLHDRPPPEQLKAVA